MSSGRGCACGRSATAIANSSIRSRRIGCSPATTIRQLPLACGLLGLRRHALRQHFPAGLAVPLLVGLVRDLPFDQQLRELPPLRLALERHRPPPCSALRRPSTDPPRRESDRMPAPPPCA